MSNESKIAYRTKLNDTLKGDAEFAFGRKAAFISTVAMISARALLFVVEVLLTFTYAYPFPLFTLASLCVITLFGMMIHRGVRPVAVLALFGGVMGVYSVWRDGLLEYFLSDGVMLVKVYGAAYILAMLLTIVPMAYLLLNANYRKYADMYTKLTQGFAAEYKTKKLDK